MVKKWFKPKGKLGNWKDSQSESTRHRHLLAEIRSRSNDSRGDHAGALSVFRALHALANVTQSRTTARTARKDAEWIKTTRAWKR